MERRDQGLLWIYISYVVEQIISHRAYFVKRNTPVLKDYRMTYWGKLFFFENIALYFLTS